MLVPYVVRLFLPLPYTRHLDTPHFFACCSRLSRSFLLYCIGLYTTIGFPQLLDTVVIA